MSEEQLTGPSMPVYLYVFQQQSEPRSLLDHIAVTMTSDHILQQ